MKKISFLVSLFAFLLLVVTSCKNSGGTTTAPTLQDQIKGKTFKSPNITDNASGADANGKFATFTIAFNGDGTQATIKYDGDVDTGGAGINVTCPATINNDVIQLGTGRPSVWTTGTLSTAKFENNKLMFTTPVTSPKTGQKVYKFDLSIQ